MSAISRAEGDGGAREFQGKSSELVMSAGADFPRPDQSCRLGDGRLAQTAIARWHDVRLRATHGILIALDMDSLDQMREVVEQTSGIPGVVGYKVGLTATLRLGLGGAVRHLRASTNLPLIYDHQKAGPDVPDMDACGPRRPPQSAV
jgi:hypothetical protein